MVLGMASAYPYPAAFGHPEFTLTAESVVDDTLYRRFFLEPTQPLHRRFAALHAFFVEGLSAQAIGQRFGLTYHTVRSWIRDCRAQCRAGQIPPFSLNRTEGDRAVTPRGSRHGRKNRLRPTAVKSTWPQAAGYALGSPACFCSCRCWPAYASTNS